MILGSMYGLRMNSQVHGLPSFLSNKICLALTLVRTGPLLLLCLAAGDSGGLVIRGGDIKAIKAAHLLPAPQEVAICGWSGQSAEYGGVGVVELVDIFSVLALPRLIHRIDVLHESAKRDINWLRH
eukprot:1868333-Amphidinium_carterae.1